MFDVKTNIIINDIQHLKKLCQNFDKKNNTLTSFGQITISDIFKYILHKDECLHVHQHIEGCFQNSFQFVDREVFSANIEGLGLLQTKSLIFFQAVYTLKKDIKKGKKIEDPICITGFDNLEYKIHPGSKRICLGSIYKDPINVIMTEYTETKKDVLDYSKFDVDFSRGDYRFRIGDFNKGFHPNDHQRKDCEFKDILRQDISTVYDHINKKNIFYLKSDKEIYANDMPIISKENGYWKII